LDMASMGADVDVVVVVGMGIVGRALYSMAVESRRYRVYGIDIDPLRSVDKIDDVPRNSRIALHIAYPYSEEFVDSVCRYIDELNPEVTIIHSTVKPGTTIEIHKRVGGTVAYSPVRGYHKCMRRHISWWSKWVATLPKSRTETVVEHLHGLGFRRVRVCDDPTTLELAKLWETTLRAIIIASWQELHRIARELRADLLTVMEFVGEVHRVLKDRPVMYPGVIGGHCLIPNTKILNSVHRSKLFEFVLESNDARMREIEDPEIAKEIELAKDYALRYAVREYFECREIDLGP